MTNVRFGFWHKVRQRKKHFCLLRCLSAFATPIKFYFDVFFKLLPYVALAFPDPAFFKIYYRPKVQAAATAMTSLAQ